MTTMAEMNPAMRRLFRRVDSAPQPRTQSLAELLEFWLSIRGDHVAPSIDAVGDLGKRSFVASSFVFARADDGSQDFLLRSGVAGVRPLLGDVPIGMSLSEAPLRRGSVRLRRLFQMVGQSSEPVLAEFDTEGPEGEKLAVELLIAPLSGEGSEVEAFLCGLAARALGRAVPSSRFRALAGPNAPLLFAFAGSVSLGGRIAAGLGVELSPLEERAFEDGEHKARPLVDVHGRHVYVIESLAGDGEQTANDRLCRLLFFVGTLKTNGAARVTVVAPYLCYMRKDRQTKPHDPLTARYVAQLIEAMGTDQLMTMEAHNFAAFQNAFRCPTLHLTAYTAFANHFTGVVKNADVTVVSPDLGAGQRAEAFRQEFEGMLERPVAKAFMEKHRSMGKVWGELFAGDVDGRIAIVIDDLISSGTTIARVAEACRKRGAQAVYAAATHGVFSEGAERHLSNDAISGIVITDTVEPIRLGGELRKRMTVIGVADIFAKEIAVRWKSGGHEW